VDKIFSHPPFLASSDFHLFPALKKHLSEKNFDSDDKVKTEVKSWFRFKDTFFILTLVLKNWCHLTTNA